MLTRAILANPQRRVIAARPPDHQVEHVILDPHDDLVDQRSDDTFAGRRRRACAVPSALDVDAEREQSFALDLGKCRIGSYRQCVAFLLERTHRPQSLVPALLQFGSDKTIIGINGVVLAAGTCCFVACLLEREFDLAKLLGILGSTCLHGADRRLDAERLKPLDDLGVNSAIDAHPTERDASVAAVIEEAAAAVITPSIAVATAVGDVQLPTAVAAAQQTGKQCLTPADRAAAQEALAVGVVADQAPIPLELRPAKGL